jgi:putative ABC transport system permease protein
MKINDVLRLSINSLTHRGLRSWLTILGIIIGVAAVVAMLSVGNGMTSNIESSMSGLGADILTVTAGYSQAEGPVGGFEGRTRDIQLPSGGGPMGANSFRQTEDSSDTEDEPTLTTDDIKAIQMADGVVTVSGIISGQGELKYLATSVRVSIEGIDPTAWNDITTSELSSGRFLSVDDMDGVVIGNSVAYQVFDTNLTVNSQVKIEGKTFKIVGILEQSGTGSFGGDDRSVFMTLTSARNILDDIDSDEFSSIEVKISDADYYEEISENIENALYASRMVTADTQDFTVTSPAAMAETITETMQTLSFFFIGIAAISLLVGAIGIANTMFMSVMERTRLIGILKSLGTRNSEIMKLFLAESGIIGFMGGLLGIFLGLILVGFITNMGLSFMGMGRMTTSTAIAVVTPDLIIFAMVFSTVIGIVSGLVPARIAAKLQVVEAMRSE